MSIFVNELQFAPGEDFARYPRNLAGDVHRLADAGVDAVFAPANEALYVPGDRTRVRVEALTEPLEGARRPGHFDGVATVVAKLFAIVGPCVAVFGRKDYQQLVVVRRMAQDLHLPVEVVGHVTVREPDGLAMSSRNRYLSPPERERALSISRGLDAAVRSFKRGERDARALVRAAAEPIMPPVCRSTMWKLPIPSRSRLSSGRPVLASCFRSRVILERRDSSTTSFSVRIRRRLGESRRIRSARTGGKGMKGP